MHSASTWYAIVVPLLLIFLCLVHSLMTNIDLDLLSPQSYKFQSLSSPHCIVFVFSLFFWLGVVLHFSVYSCHRFCFNFGLPSQSSDQPPSAVPSGVFLLYLFFWPLLTWCFVFFASGICAAPPGISCHCFQHVLESRPSFLHGYLEFLRSSQLIYSPLPWLSSFSCLVFLSFPPSHPCTVFQVPDKSVSFHPHYQIYY